MAVLRPLDKLPMLNSGVLLLVGTDEALQQKLAEAVLQEKKDFNISIHLARSLPLPSERDHLRPRIDLIVFMIDIKSKYSLKNVETSLAYVDANFFLGKVCFLVTGVGRGSSCYCSTTSANITDLCWSHTRSFCLVLRLTDEEI
ncbi:PREDICTED: centromere protein M isoform X2 [Pseudopodoces humilis]|uniref:centromere protein M isoform X2 n=1 Tax=Pseudopodoces humilis TaxID=181119 RepID=UPI0006B84C56|nr:PREDICTED: centromere protein M isoform X2 [Pseudopodoces humilis]